MSPRETPSGCFRNRPLVLAVMLMAIIFEGIANAQSSNGYVVGGVGSYNSKLISQAAIGGEKVFGKGIGAGGELGFVAGHTSFGFVSLNGYYHLAHNGAAQKVDPFVTGGFTSAFNLFGSATNGANLGLGLHYWFLPHLGVRAEFRDIVFLGTSQGANVWGFRGGIAFR
jgi:hypothetical protein